MRTIASAAVIGLTLAFAACSQPEQDKAQAEANEAASDVKTGAVKVGNEMEANVDKAGQELKEITSDPDVKRAASEAKDALKDMGVAIKDASDKDKPADQTAANDAAQKK